MQFVRRTKQSSGLFIGKATQVGLPPSAPRRSTALRQQFAIANSTTDGGLLLFPKNLLLCKIFSGTLITLATLVRFSHVQVYQVELKNNTLYKL